MNPHTSAADTLPNPPVAVMADWAETLTRSAREALDRMDTTLSLSEAKLALIARIRARRRETGARD
jgi:hypothetical protein